MRMASTSAKSNWSAAWGVVAVSILRTRTYWALLIAPDDMKGTSIRLTKPTMHEIYYTNLQAGGRWTKVASLGVGWNGETRVSAQFQGWSFSHVLSIMSSPTATAHSLNKILNQYKHTSKIRTSSDVEESVQKLRRLILLDQVPSEVVCCHVQASLEELMFIVRIWRIRHFAQEYGKYYYASRMCHQIRSLNTLREDLVKFEKRFVMIHSGSC